MSERERVAAYLREKAPTQTHDGRRAFLSVASELEEAGDFPKGEPLSPAEADMRDQWLEAMSRHELVKTPDTWQRRLAATGAYRAVYEWNQAS